jgi:integrase
VQSYEKRSNQKKVLDNMPHTIEETQKLLTLLEQEPENNLQFVTYINLAIFTGCRRGELLGLEWKDIDFDNSLITINRAAYHTTERGHYTDTPKTKKSVRPVGIDTKILELLKRYRDYQLNYASKLGNKWVSTDRVFTAWNGTFMFPDAPMQFYKKFCDLNGLRTLALHSMRHLNASILIHAGLDIKTVQTRLGHATATTTLNTYAHYFQSAQARATEAVSSALGAALSN